MKKILITAVAMLLGFAASEAQSPESYVQKYNSLVNAYLADGDVEMRDQIDMLLRGGRNKCYISNRMGRDMALERNIDVELMHSDTYHNQLYNWRKKGVVDNISLENITWMQSWEEPRLKIGPDQPPIQFVSANLRTTGSRQYDTSDLFYVQSGHIVSIVDMGRGGLGNAMRLYNEKNYDEAFKLFRHIAYTNRNALKARYYTAVMLITGKGCKNIDKKVRDNDAAWLGLSGYLTADGDLAALANKFSMQLPFSEHDIYGYAPAYNGRRVIKKGHDKYGIIDDSGRMILNFRKGDSGPLSCSGYAVVVEPGSKKGLMDSDGNIVIPYDYDVILPYSHKGNIFAIKNGSLLLLSDTGVLLKRIDGAFTHLEIVTRDGLIMVCNGGKYELYNYDGQLVYDHNSFGRWKYEKNTGELTLQKDDETIYSSMEMW